MNEEENGLDFESEDNDRSVVNDRFFTRNIHYFIMGAMTILVIIGGIALYHVLSDYEYYTEHPCERCKATGARVEMPRNYITVPKIDIPIDINDSENDAPEEIEEPIDEDDIKTLPDYETPEYESKEYEEFEIDGDIINKILEV